LKFQVLTQFSINGNTMRGRLAKVIHDLQSEGFILQKDFFFERNEGHFLTD
jgi:hypothetical protein